MRFGFFGAGVGGMMHPAAGEVAAYAEQLGYASMWTGEHVVMPVARVDYMKVESDWPFGDPMITLAFLSAHTSMIRLCTGVVILPQRHPVQMAKEVATLDVLSAGRLVLGVGMGHLASEFAAVGVPMKDRAARGMEYIEAMRALWRHDTDFEGRYVRFHDVIAYPSPHQPGGPSIVMGGHSPASLRRAAVHASGWYGWGLSPDEVRAALTVMREEADSHGRDLSGFEVSLTPLKRLHRGDVDDYAAAGVDELVLTVEAPTLDGVRRRLERNAPCTY
jgi:probable F420-dependent oxidoreductase